MADSGSITGTIGNVAGGAINIGMTIVIVLFVLAVAVAIFFYVKHQKKYNQFKCIVWKQDSFGQVKETTDQAGIFVDKKTKNKRFFLKKNNVGLEPDNIPYILSDKGKKIVYLLQTGLKNFRFIKPNINNEKILKFKVGEEDVNWAVNAYERQKQIFSNNALLQYLPFIALAFVSVIILIIFIYFFKELSVLKDFAASLKSAADVLANAQTGTAVLS